MKNIKWLCHQMIVVKTTPNGSNNLIAMETIVRTVFAKNEAEAIGKFILATKDIQNTKRLELFCYKLDDLKEIH